jgi:Nucleotidyl transferase AbiEii toxin, Type IV TA system
MAHRAACNKLAGRLEQLPGLACAAWLTHRSSRGQRDIDKEEIMAKKTKPSAAEELERREKIKKLVIIAMFSDDALMERLVLKGGNALDLIHHVSSRASVDVDLSIDGDFTPDERLTLQGRIEKVLRDTFRPEGYQVFDVKLQDQPRGLTADVADFWGGYIVEFKLIELDRYEELEKDVEVLRKYAVQLGQGPKFSIDISKYEYTVGKMKCDLDGFAVFVYSPEMIVCEKLRAICQQMPEYGPVVKRNRPGSARARDFIDIHSVMNERKVDPATQQNRELLSLVFAAKRVKLSLLRKVNQYREFHRTNYEAVAATVKAGVTLKEFDFYVEFVLDVIKQLEPLGDE